jgi:hypothetical protein
MQGHEPSQSEPLQSHSDEHPPDDFELELPEPILDRFKYDEEFSKYLCPRSSSGRLLFAFIARTLWAFHLHKLYSEAHILNEVYIRGAKSINNGTVIHNLLPWIKQTSYFYIRELKREQQKTEPFEDYMSDTLTNPIAPDVIEGDLALLGEAFKQLDRKDQQLLNLKIAQGFSWRQIQETFVAEGTGHFTEQSLRKRKERALIRLRKRFHQLKSTE